MSGLVVLNVVGLTPAMVSAATPCLQKLVNAGSMRPLEAAFPAVTMTAQASMLTGLRPEKHGIVGNGWYFRELEEVLFWRQAHALIEAEDLPTRLRRELPGFRVAKLFWWFNMYAPVDFAVTPRPMYPADGRKIPDIHTFPARLRTQLQDRFGTFPLFHFWGPMADLRSSRWIAEASAHLLKTERPDLALVYLPHLDYDFQRYGPTDARSLKALREVDALVGQLADEASSLGMRTCVVSEYGIDAVDLPVHPNRILRSAGLFEVRQELGLERPDPGASRAFAVSDHQVAHVYVRSASDISSVVELFSKVPGIADVLVGDAIKSEGLEHPRSGEVILVARKNAWFTYYFWEDDRSAPDYARTVDIHRKIGYDPAELLINPSLVAPKLRILRKLVGKKLGLRTLLDVIGLDATVVKGSHGLRPVNPMAGPILISPMALASDPTTPFPLSELPRHLERCLS